MSIFHDSDSDIEFNEDNLNKIPTKKCNNIYEKCGKRIHCKSRIPMNSNNICKKCRWRKEDNNSHKSNDSCDSNISAEIKEEEETIEISIPMPINNNEGITNILEDFELQTILIDKNTVSRMETKLNQLYDEILEIFEKNMCSIGSCDKINKTVILFIKYCKIRSIISDGSIKQKYNPNYFGVRNNTNKLLSIIEKKAVQYQKKYNEL